MTIDKTTPYWEQDIVECLRIAANAVGKNSYYLRAAEYIEELRAEKRDTANEFQYLKEQVNLLRETNKASQVYRLAAEQKLQRVLDFINDDAFAVKCQTVGEYRAAALNSVA